MNFRSEIPKIITPSSLPELKIKSLQLKEFTHFYFPEEEEDLVRISFAFHCGKIDEQQRGLNQACVQLLLSGNEMLSSLAIQEEFDKYGAFVELESGFRESTIQIFTLKEHAQKVLRFLAEVLSSVNFPENEVRIYKNRSLESLKVKKQKTSFLSKKEFKATLFGRNTPYGSTTEEIDIQNINRDLLINHFNNYFKNSLVSIYSNSLLPEYYLEPLLVFSRGTSIPEYVWNGPKNISGINKIQKDEAVQASISMGFISENRKSSDYPSRSFLSTVLGGYFGSRLMKNIREEKGLTYGIGASFTNYPDLALFQIRTDVKNDLAEEALTEIFKEIQRLRDECILEDEISIVRNYMMGSLQRAFDGSLNMIDRFKSLKDLGLQTDYFQNYIHDLLSIQAQTLQEIAGHEFKEERFLTVVAGNFAST